MSDVMGVLQMPGPFRKQRAELAVRLGRIRRRFKRPARDYLEASTGRDSVYWVEFIQKAISDSFRDNPADPDHPLCDPEVWAVQLIFELMERRPSSYGDENMWLAGALCLAAGTWAVRIQRAKAFDPRRPVELRKEAYNRWLGLIQAMAMVAADESTDPQMFEQPWESPFLPDATDGQFV